MRPIQLSMPPTSSVEAKLDWCIRAIQEISRASYVADPGVIADGFSVSNVTTSRTLDADTATTAEVADVLATLLQDLKQRGAKRGGE